MSEKSKNFDMRIVYENFEIALSKEDDVQLQNYLESFEELNKFFTLIGTVFSFVSNDLKAKMDILYELLKDPENGNNFATTKAMIDYELQNDLLNKKDYTSGARTLLRLHRGLDFIQLFLKKLGDLKDEESTSTACREAYDQTLSKHHTFLIRNGARIAIYTLPTKEVLLKRVCGGEEDIKQALDMLPRTLEVTSSVFQRIENLYSKHKLHELP
nr:ceramide-1-phosphate transfer protein [Leptinotarsa decemlineata]